MKKTSLIISVFVITILGVFLIISSCKKEEAESNNTPSAIPEVNEYTLYENVIVLDSLTTPDPIIEGNKYTFNFTTSPPDFKVGDVIIGYTNGGYLKKITSIEKSTDETNFIITLYFVQALLDEVFKNCNFVHSIPIITQEKTLDGTVLFDEQVGNVDLDVTIQEGYVKSGMYLVFKLQRVDGQTKYFETKVIGDIDIKTDVELSANGQISYNSGDKLLLPPIKFWFSIGVVPVEVVLGFYGRFETSISATGILGYSCLLDGNVEFGATWTESEQWKKIWEKDAEYINNGIEWDYSLNTNAKVIVKPEIKLLVIGLAGPTLNLEPFLEFDANLNNQIWAWSLKGGYTGNIGVELNTLGLYEIADYNTPLLKWETTIASDQGSIGGGGVGEPCPDEPYFTYHGQTYNTVLIGNQCWMKENLNYETENSVCYDNNQSNCDIYGRLYNWNTIMNGEASSNSVPSGVQGICPNGWHVPSDAEWILLFNQLGGEEIAGGKLKEGGTSHWHSPNTGATNESGFTALPSGKRTVSGGFSSIGEMVWFWTSSQTGKSAWTPALGYNSGSVNHGYSTNNFGLSLRCVKD